MKIKKTIAFIAALCISSSALGAAVYADDEVTAVVQEAESIEYSAGKYVSGNFQYTLSDIGEATITRYFGSEKNVVVPSVIDGYPVVSVEPEYISYDANNFFEKPKEVISITIPEGVTSIGKVCAYCPNITTVSLPSSLKTISNFAFDECAKLENINIPNNITSIGVYAFYGCVLLKSINIPQGVTEIRTCTFRGCKSLTSVTLGSAIEKIDDFAFEDCEKLTSINFPNSLKELGESVFENCKSLKEAALPDTIESLDSGIFKDCSSLINVTLPSKIKKIDTKTFYNCENLAEVIVPPDVTSITSDAFTNCKNAMICYPRTAKINDKLSNVGASITYMISDDKAIITGVSSELSVINIPGNIYGYPVVDFVAEFNGRVNHSHYPSAEDCVICSKVASPMEKFVERLYTVILNRNSDSEGKNNHVSNLEKGESACKVAYDFIFSNEFLNSSLSNEEVVAKMYRVFLDREPDAGSKTWVDALNSGCSYAAVMYGVSQSNEFTELCDKYGIVRGDFVVTENRDRSANLTAFVNRLYNKTLGRNGEPEGLNSHTGAYLQDRDVEKLAYNFVFSAEFTNKNHSDEEFVEIMYQAFFGRDSDPTGREHWLSVLANGGSRYDVFLGFIGSQECKELVESFGI